MLKLGKCQAHETSLYLGQQAWRGTREGGWAVQAEQVHSEYKDRGDKLAIPTSEKRTQHSPAHNESDSVNMKTAHCDRKVRSVTELHVLLRLGRQDLTLISTRHGCLTRGSPATEANVHRP